VSRVVDRQKSQIGDHSIVGKGQPLSESEGPWGFPMKLITVLTCLLLIIIIAGCTSTGSGTPAVADTSAAPVPLPSAGTDIALSSSGHSYPAYVSAPAGTAGTKRYPGIVLIHSFNGLEPGYRTLADRFAAGGYVIVAPQWQTFNASPSDEEVQSLIQSGIDYLDTRQDVDPARLGLTGFCAGGRYTMLFLPQMKEFKSGVAWYGFPYNPGFANETRPVDHIGTLNAPMLMIHGSADQASHVTDIYQYAVALNQAQKYFELKVYEGQPHGFMIVNGSLNDSDIARDAFGEMVNFFDRSLKGAGISG
jgi:carboxymethylenebutenolidase